jgi:hypothetical protein
MAEGARKSGLEFLLSLNDRLTGPLGRVAGTVQSRFGQLNASANAAAGNIKLGFIAGTGAALGLVAALGPAIQFNKELSRVQALGVGAEALAVMKAEALGLSNTFGVSALSVVQGARAIRAEMGNLGEAELIRVTRAATLAGQALGLDNPAERLAKSMQKIGAAQKVLGMNLTDSSGAALGPTALIEKLQGRFGKIDTARESDLIRQAFGDESLQLMTLLINNSEILRGNLSDIANTDLGKRLRATADPFERWHRSMENVVLVWGGFLLPLITPWVDAVSDMAKRMQSWAGRFPHLTRLIGLLTVALLGSALAVGLLKIGWGLLTLSMLPVKAGLWAIQGALWLTKAALASEALMIGVTWLAMTGLTAATWLFNLALWANPLTWIVAGLIALVAAIALVIVYWDQVRAAAAGFFDALPGWAKLALLVLQPLIWIPLAIIEHWDTLRNLVSDAAGWAGGLLDRFGIGAVEAPSTSLTRMPAAEPLSAEARQMFSNVANSDSSRKISIERLTIQPKEEVGPDYLQRTLLAEGLG